MNVPITQRCQWCGQNWWDTHVCSKLVKTPLVQPSTRVIVPIDEQRVREIVREEIERALLRPTKDARREG